MGGSQTRPDPPPLWKRRIVAAGLAVLAAIGAYPVAKVHPYNKPKPTVRPTCYSLSVPVPPSSQPTSARPTFAPGDSQCRVDLLRQLEERGILAPPVADRARQQYNGEV